MDMAEILQASSEEPLAPDLSHLITEDDKPVHNRFSERQQKFFSQCLFDSWEQGKPFEALVDVGLFSRPTNEDVVSPDFLLSVGVEPRPLTGDKENRSYYLWLYGQPPTLVIEVVSNKEGEELGRKFEIYQKLGVAYYAILDPFGHLGQRELRLFQSVGGRYVELAQPNWMPELGLGFTFWEGSYLDVEYRWLRFTDEKGELLLTGQEKADLMEGELQASQSELASSQSELAASHTKLAEAEAKAERMEAKLRELGMDVE
jgi:Uma2 family endonuclease